MAILLHFDHASQLKVKMHHLLYLHKLVLQIVRNGLVSAFRTSRYATKKYDSGKKVSQADIDKITEAARLAPSSYGIQPYRVIVISNSELKSQILPIAWNQQIVVDCSHLLVFAAWDKYTNERVEGIFNHMADLRGTPREAALGSQTKDIIASQVSKVPDEAYIDAAKQVCISLGIAIAQAAELQIDNTPMGGFKKEELDTLLGLEEKGLKSVYLLALGYRSQDGDWLVNLKKARTPKENFLINFA